MNNTNRILGRRFKAALKSWSILAAGLGAAGFLGHAQATEIDLHDNDFALRWDNTIRYTLGDRAQAPSYKLLNDANASDGDRNFQHGVTTNRVDIFSEADLVYKRMLGARISGDFWYDAGVASMQTAFNPTPGNLSPQGLPTGGLANYTKRFFEGPSGELYDAFAFVNFDVADKPINIKVGRHTEIWGESLLLSGAINGISYSQAPIDVAKAYGNPGAEAKELFRPVNNVTASVQLSDNLSLQGQYFLEWQAFRYPEDGTYYGMYDLALYGGQVGYLGAAQGPVPAGQPGSSNLWVQRGADLNPKQTGPFGVATRWSPDFIDGTVGLYYRRFTDMNPQLAVVPSSAGLGEILDPKLGAVNPALGKLFPIVSSGNLGTYNLTYQENINMYGASLSKQIGGISFGAEFNYRTGMALSSDPGVIVYQNSVPIPAPFQTALGKALTGQAVALPAFTPSILYSLAPNGAVTNIPSQGHDVGAVGNTAHGVLNAVGLFNGNAIWDSASWIVEGTWSHLVAITANPSAYLGRTYNLGYSDSFRATRNAYTGAVGFTPTWFSVFPSVDVSMPTSFSVGLSGNSPVALGGNKNTGTYSIGVNALVDQVYSVTLQYAGDMGELRLSPTAGTVQNGLGSLLADRGTLYLIFKTTF
jgi:hypothetical protein